MRSFLQKSFQFLLVFSRDRTQILVFPELWVWSENVGDGKFVNFLFNQFEEDGIAANWNTIFIKNFCFIVPADHLCRDEDQKNEEDYWKDVELILFFYEEIWKSDTNSIWLLSIGVTIFKAVLFLLLVCEAFIAFGNHYEFFMGLRISLIFIGVIFSCQNSVWFFYLWYWGIFGHL